jgi:hypothetical protein
VLLKLTWVPVPARLDVLIHGFSHPSTDSSRVSQSATVVWANAVPWNWMVPTRPSPTGVFADEDVDDTCICPVSDVSHMSRGMTSEMSRRTPDHRISPRRTFARSPSFSVTDCLSCSNRVNPPISVWRRPLAARCSSS